MDGSIHNRPWLCVTTVLDADGFDPAISGYRINPTGSMNPAVGASVPSFNIRLLVRVQ